MVSQVALGNVNQKQRDIEDSNGKFYEAWPGLITVMKEQLCAREDEQLGEYRMMLQNCISFLGTRSDRAQVSTG
jgi:hypothetical protein